MVRAELGVVIDSIRTALAHSRVTVGWALPAAFSVLTVFCRINRNASPLVGIAHPMFPPIAFIPSFSIRE